VLREQRGARYRQAMYAHDLGTIAADLERSRKRVRDARSVAFACAVIALGAWMASAVVAAAFAVGAVAGVLLSLIGTLSRQDKIALLALDPSAYELPDVSQYSYRLTHRLERERLASWIIEILAEAASIPGNWYVVPRVIRYADELAELSDDLADPYAHIRPASAAAAHLLLTQAVDSPLYNPALPDDLLQAIIAKVRLGISRSPG
jgi:hypothetical protein